MSIMITPAGHKNVDWAPSDNKLKKTASTEDGSEVQEETNPLYEAAKSYIEKSQQKEATDDTCEEVEEAEEIEEKVGSVADAVKEVEEKADVAEAKVEAVQEALGQIDEAVQSVKEVCGEVDAAEAEVDKVDEVDDEVEIEIEVQDDQGEEDKGEEGLVVESEPEVEGCGAVAEKAEEVAMDKAASTTEEFCRYSMISEPNRKKLVEYWVNALGYPRDYVKLLVKDYE